MRIERSAPRTTTKTTAASSEQRAEQQQRRARRRPRRRRRATSRMIAPKSAIDAAAMISCPNVEEISPASLSTGTSTPSEVAHRMIATSSGVSTRPPALEPEADTTSAIANESAKPERGQPQHRPAQLLELDLEPGEEEHEREADQRDDLDRPRRPRPSRAPTGR